MKSSILNAKSLTRIGTWNVRTLYQCGTLAQLIREFKMYKLSIIGISEMRWTGSGKVNSDGISLLYSGHPDQHVRGVGLMLDSEASRALIGWVAVSDRIISARFQTRFLKMTVIQVYAPTEEADDADKDAFYEQLQDILDEAPSHDVKLVMGDWNAQLDQNRSGLEQVKGPYASGRRTTGNGERLQLFCGINNLAISNTFFAHRNIHKRTWVSPDGKTRNEIDYFCISKRWFSSVQDTKVCRGADVGSDHYLLRATLKLKLKKMQRAKIERPIAVERLKETVVAENYQLAITNKFQALQDVHDLEEQWDLFQKAVMDSATEIIGRRRGSHRERWITPVTWTLIDNRREIKHKRDQAKTEQTYKSATVEYRAADRLVKRSCRKDKQKWLEGKTKEAQEAATRNDSKTLYRLVRDLTGYKGGSGRSVPVKDKSGKALLTEEDQNARWVEHFRETLNQPEPSETFEFTDDTRREEDINHEPFTEAEVRFALKKLKNNKAPGIDQIVAELLKKGGNAIISELTKLCNRCWNEKNVPEEWTKGIIVKIPKKGDLSDCGNWRGITLLSVPAKVLCAVLLHRLKTELDGKLREEQAGFRSGRSCTEQIFTLRNIMEQCIEFQRPLEIIFIDFMKAFDSVHRDAMWHIAKEYGIPQDYIAIFKSLYRNSSCCVKTEQGNTDFFKINTGVRQGCLLSPMLFLLVIDFVMRRAMVGRNSGIPWTNENRLTDLNFADDIALLAETRSDIQQMTTRLADEAAKVGLKISNRKTKTMRVHGANGANSGRRHERIHIYQDDTDDVDSFCYLGSTMRSNGEADDDVKRRIGLATSVFRRMNNIWRSKSITTEIKITLFKTIVLSTAIYASETWRTTKKIMHQLDVFQQRCLRKILRITYRQRITNSEILKRSQMRSLHEIVTERRVRLAGHVLRMDDQRIAKTAIRWTPPGGRRKRGRPKKTWRSTFTADLDELGLSWNQAHVRAQDRGGWRCLAARCTGMYRRN